MLGLAFANVHVSLKAKSLPNQILDGVSVEKLDDSFQLILREGQFWSPLYLYK